MRPRTSVALSKGRVADNPVSPFEYTDSMRATQGRFRVLVLVVLIGSGVIFSVSWMAIAWSFDYFGLHTRVRWLLHAAAYKSGVRSEPQSQDGLLRHVESDSWGFAGSNTVLYLVFDPSDLLLDASHSNGPGKYPGLLCAVVRVYRLEKNWYTVRFYTDRDWNRCKM